MINEHNRVHLHGTLSIRKSSPAANGKKAWARGSIKPTGGKSFVSLLAFDKAAEDLGNAHELTVTLTGHIEGDRPKDPKPGEQWPLVVVVDEVEEHAPRGAKASNEDIPF